MQFKGGTDFNRRFSLSADFPNLLRKTGAPEIPGSRKLRHRLPATLALAFAALLLLLIPAESLCYNVLFTTRGATPNAGEQLRINMIEGWGHTVTLVEDSATQAVYDAAIATSDVAYVTEETQSTSLGTKLTNACIGVVTEDPATTDDLGFCSAQSMSSYTSEQVYINDNTHYITQGFLIGSYTLFTGQLRLNQMDRTNNVSADARFYAWRPTNSNLGALVVMDIGAALVGGGTANGRRVMLPWGDHQTTEADFVKINANGETIMRRSLEWAAMQNGCLGLTKKAFLADGTPVTNGETLAKGTEVRFLIYINNTGSTARNDVSMQDVLDAGFGYQSPSLKTATMASCALSVCTAAEEQNIYDTVVLTGTKGDPGDLADEVSYTAATTTIDAGNQNVGNQQLDIPANSLWALLMTVRVK